MSSELPKNFSKDYGGIDNLGKLEKLFENKELETVRVPKKSLFGFGKKTLTKSSHEGYSLTNRTKKIASILKKDLKEVEKLNTPEANDYKKRLRQLAEKFKEAEFKGGEKKLNKIQFARLNLYNSIINASSKKVNPPVSKSIDKNVYYLVTKSIPVPSKFTMQDEGTEFIEWKTEITLMKKKPQSDKNILITELRDLSLDIERFNNILKKNAPWNHESSNIRNIRCETGKRPGDLFIHTDEQSSTNKNGKLYMILTRSLEDEYQCLLLENLDDLPQEKLIHTYKEICKLDPLIDKMFQDNIEGNTHFKENIALVKEKLESNIGKQDI